MRSKINKRIPAGNIIPVMLSICLFCLVLSCHRGSNKNIIPEKKLVQLLVDIHLADGIALTLPYANTKRSVDSAALYNAVFDKHRIDRARFDTTMAYYARRPEKLQSVYSKVNTVLSKRESDLLAGSASPAAEKKIMIWQDSKIYALPQMGRTNKVEISVPVNKPGLYTVSAKIRIFDDDQTVAPRMTLFFWYDNGSPAGYREYFRNSPLTRDGRTGTYSISHKLVNPRITYLKGYILDHSNPDSLFTKHAVVSDIKVFYRE